MKKMEQIKVVFLGTLPPIIGLSPYCLHLSLALSKRVDLIFFNFHRFSCASRKFMRSAEINRDLYIKHIKRLNVKNCIDWYNPISSIKVGSQLEGDVLHVQWWLSLLIAVYLPIILCAKIKNIKVVMSIHNVLPHERSKINLFIDKIFNKIVFRFANHFIVHNERNKQKLIDVYRIDENKISIITHGAFDLVKSNNISQKVARKHLGLPEKSKILLFFGYIRKYKGVDILIQAFSHLRKEFDDVILLIVGQPIDDDWGKYDELIRKNGLENVVILEPGFVPEDEVKYYFSASDVVVLPYKYLDTHGGVGALALSFNKPLIVTDVGGLPEYVKDMRAVVKPNDVNELYKKLKTILENEILLRKLGKDSKRLRKKLSWDNIADKTVKVYKKVLM
ncbi:MAG: glycosyltransferase family 4 protein [Thermoplasmata archaeon]|nr:glycosyltransferase family 4 protein [Thermoplasmata archaeon]